MKQKICCLLFGFVIGIAVGMLLFIKPGAIEPVSIKRAAPQVNLMPIEAEGHGLRIFTTGKYGTVPKSSESLRIKFEFMDETNCDCPDDRSGYTARYKLSSINPKVPLAFLIPIESIDESFFAIPLGAPLKSTAFYGANPACLGFPMILCVFTACR